MLMRTRLLPWTFWFQHGNTSNYADRQAVGAEARIQLVNESVCVLSNTRCNIVAPS